MEQEQNATNSAQIAEATSRPMQNDERKMSKKQIVGMVILSLIAIGGVLFGIYGMNSQNEQIAELTVKVKDAEGKATQLETEKITITDADGGVTEITDSVPVQQNPIITAPESIIYQPTYRMPYTHSSGSGEISFMIENGQFKDCYMVGALGGDCSVNGLPGGIYKMSTIYEGNGIGDEKIGFVMDDGSVYYAPIYNSTDEVNVDLTVKKADIDGFVKDIIRVNYCSTESRYCYGSTVFVMGDNSLVKYNKSMFE